MTYFIYQLYIASWNLFLHDNNQYKAVSYQKISYLNKFLSFFVYFTSVYLLNDKFYCTD